MLGMVLRDGTLNYSFQQEKRGFMALPLERQKPRLQFQLQHRVDTDSCNFWQNYIFIQLCAFTLKSY